MAYILMLVIAASTFSLGYVEGVLKEPCHDEISVDTCWNFRKLGLCEKMPDKLRNVCSKTCGFCMTCQDAYIKPKCEEFKALGRCLKDPLTMRHLCPETCGFCPKKCIDNYRGCKLLSSHRACYEFQLRMRIMCPATCGFCNPTTSCDTHACPIGFRCQLTDELQPYCACDVECNEATMFGSVCGKNGKTYPHLCELKKDECKSLKFIAVKFYGDCNKVAFSCKDEPRESEAGLCKKWKEVGACRDHISLMEIYCKKTCGYCRVPGAPTKPKCLDSKFGCCWNGIDVARQDRYGKGCAPCKDLKFCKYFKPYCNSRLSHEFMKRKCPLTCGYCIPEYIQRLHEKQWIIERRRRHLKSTYSY